MEDPNDDFSLPWTEDDESQAAFLQSLAAGNIFADEQPPDEADLKAADANDAKLKHGKVLAASVPRSPNKRLARAKSVPDSPAKRSRGVCSVSTPVPLKEDSKECALTSQEKKKFCEGARHFFQKEQRSKPIWKQMESRKKSHEISKLYALLTQKEKCDWALRWLEEDGKLTKLEKDKYLTHRMITHSEESIADSKSRKSKFFSGSSGMFSYHSNLWKFKADEKLVEAMSMTEAEAFVKNTEQYKKIVPELSMQIGELVSKLVVVYYSWSFELCPQAFSTKQQLKGHLHVTLDWPHRVYYRSEKSFLVGDALPTNARGDCRLQRRAGACSSHPMHYYCQIPKVGALCQSTNFTKFEQFQINPRWISNWFQAKKLSFAMAEQDRHIIFVHNQKNKKQ
jgi:hypothetical protein